MRLLLPALALLTPPLLSAVPPDCRVPHTSREKLVCSSKDLSALDTRLNQAFAALPAQLTPASVELVRSDQREWLLWVDKVCPVNNPAVQPEACLETQDNERIGELTDGIQHINGILFFTRAHYVYTPGKLPAASSDDARFDPGFGYGAYAWPQIDAPDRDHAAFNKAAYQAAIATETFHEQKKVPASFEDGTPATGSIDAFTSVLAVNEHLVDVDLSSERYDWGGAHPTTDRYSLLWSTALQHPLTGDDILRPGSGWQTSLVEPSITKLHKTDAGPNLWDGKELTDAVAAALANPQQWDLSHDGLSITFAQYQVTCYACGTPEITFSWEELKPYLNPAFDPSTLPTRAPNTSP